MTKFWEPCASLTRDKLVQKMLEEPQFFWELVDISDPQQDPSSGQKSLRKNKRGTPNK
jgi:hypothetical protein